MDKNKFDKNNSYKSRGSNLPSNNYDDDFDDFDPRGTSAASEMPVCYYLFLAGLSMFRIL